MDDRIDAIHSALTEMGIGGVKRKSLDRTINHITKSHFEYIREISKKITNSVDSLLEVMTIMEIRGPGRFVTYLTMIANSNITEGETKILVRKLVEVSDPKIIPRAEELIRRISKIDERSYWHQCII